MHTIKTNKRNTILLFLTFRIGFSAKKYVKMLSPNANPTMKDMLEKIDVLP